MTEAGCVRFNLLDWIDGWQPVGEKGVSNHLLESP